MHMERLHNVKPEQYLYGKRCILASFTIDIEAGKQNGCPILGCTGGSKHKWEMYCHFCLKHAEAKLVIQEEGELTKMQPLQNANKNISRHQQTKACQKGQRRRKNKTLQDNQHQARKVNFYVNGQKLEKVSEFKYLGRKLTNKDDNTKAIKHQIRQVWQQWNCIAKILKQEGGQFNDHG